ncbi:SubName: Full=Uncharacterized protein {ECO:0000313/EMBL:CCA70792.1} [Serendipita indica DSM 11827]|uniref:F-box domain-containing protein n=1 Tax=Serendipita indica (strain DSM 11827) TaxID=1109443 RepID=G4THJ9_SERID|nr:SubName: Full=Uncharacterized protein {ECO:0000313/EMBL:CCA70792.1} [Serendipita indica DSM 11827]CCA70792.1 hypothetical protein PIIN_04727 [Serendipita indica DSM 11827]
MGWLELQLSRASTQTLEIEWAVADNPEWPLFKDELLDIFTRWAPIERWHSLRVTELAPRHIPFFRSLIFTKTFENLESFVWESFDEERHTMLPLVDAHLPPLPTSKFRQFECDFHIDHAQLHGSIATLIQYTSRFWTQDLRDFGEHFLPPNVHELLVSRLPDFPLPHVTSIRISSLHNLNSTTLPNVSSLTIRLLVPRTFPLPVEFDTLRELSVAVVDFQLLEMIQAPNLHSLSIGAPTELYVPRRSHINRIKKESLLRVFAQGSQYSLNPPQLSIRHPFPLDILEHVVRHAKDTTHLSVKFRNTYDMGLFISRVLLPAPSMHPSISSLASKHVGPTYGDDITCPDLKMLTLDLERPRLLKEHSSLRWRVDQHLIALYSRRLFIVRKGSSLEGISFVVDRHWRRFSATELDALHVDGHETEELEDGYHINL